MAKVFITGSADGLGSMAAAGLCKQGHEVVIHARDASRAQHAAHKVPGAAGTVTADLSDMNAVINLASVLNKMGRFDAVIHNAGVYQVPATVTLAVNTIAPYLLTSLMTRPARLIYLSSGMHRQGNFSPAGLSLHKGASYADSKLHVVMLAKAVARHWPGVYANAVDPGWVPTKMGGPGAPDDLRQGVETQTWLAVSQDTEAAVSGRYFYHKEEETPHRQSGDIALQEALLDACGRLTGITFPRD